MTELQRRPAEVLAARILPPRMRDLDVEVWTDSRYVLPARVRKAVERGEIAEVSGWRPVTGWPGYYSVEVRRLRPARRAAPAWRKWAIGVGATFSVLAGLACAAAVFLPVWLGYLIMLCGIGSIVGSVVVKIASGRTINITQNVTIRK